jgi:hypothetical protein
MALEAKLGFEDSTGLEEDFVVPPEMEPMLVDILPRGYLSHAQASTLLQCGYKYFLMYIERVHMATVARMFQGSSVHKGVEHVLKVKMQTGRLPSIKEALDAYSTAFEDEKGTVEDWEGAEPGAVKDLGAKLSKIYFEEVAPKAAPIAVEKTFSTIIKSRDGKMHLPVLGRIDSIQVMIDNPERAYDPEAASNMPRHMQRIHDLKVVTNKWAEGKLANSLQFATYAAVEGIPNVQADLLVKGQAKIPRPRYEEQSTVITPNDANHAIGVLQDVATSISLGHWSKTDPGNWWCSKKWCGVWHECRGKNQH